MSRFRLLPVSGNAKIRVGILGGTFNPAHEGHRYISLEAIKRLNLDYVVWLVSPQNPLKSEDVKGSLNTRVEIAENTKHSNKIIVSDIEKYFKNNFTANSINRIKKMHGNVEFVWLMGADNMMHIHKWYQWKQIFRRSYVVVFDRFSFGIKVNKSKAANIFPSHKMLNYGNVTNFKNKNWCFFKIRQNPISSTQIRSRLKYEKSK
ncbi:nicotinate (nicotinamide) nucleotide adenylyltransferase [Holosporaceae bacterium 'Namur']|nr:nicotinate (nicotinamide) nucleotide adenylyltransferase [Holosporaceae bacterium 'Namur']